MLVRARDIREEFERLVFDEEPATKLQRRLGDLEELAACGAAELDVTRGETWWSDGLLRLLGVDALEAGDRFEPVLQRVAVEDRQVIRAALDSLISDVEPYSVECRFVLPDGRFRWVRSRGRGHVDRRGTPTRLVTTWIDIAEDRHLVEWLAGTVLEDPLTGLVNRFVVDDRLNVALKRSREPSPGVTVFYVDIDGFDQLNRALGHRRGDEVLRAISQRLERTLRAGDTLGRYGADEFVVVCEEVAGVDDALVIARRLRDAARVPMSGLADDVSAGVGIARALAAETTHALMGRAALASAAAKRQGRGGVAMAPEDS